MNTFIQKVIDLHESSTIWLLVFTILFTVLVMITVLSFDGRRKRILASQIPGPVGWPIIGLLPLFLQDPEKLIKCGIQVYRMYDKSLFKFWVFHKLYIVLTQPQDIEMVLTNPKLQKKAKEYLVLQESIMGQGIFSIEDIRKWKHNRKLVSGGFNFTIIKSFIPIFYEESMVLNKILQTKCNSSNECDISIPVSMATMEMIGKTAMGVTFNAQNGGHHRFIENLKTAMATWEYRVTHPWYLNKTLFRLSSVKRKHDQSQKIINKFTDEIISQKIYELNENSDDDKKLPAVDEDICSRKTKTFIEILLGNYHEMSHEQIRDELATIMIGGQETTAMTNACIIFMLAHHQDVQNKVYEELQSIFSVGDYTRTPTYEDLQQMKYLERVIKETLRLFPPLPIYGRCLDEEIKIGKYLCPAGATLIISPLFMQSSPQYYTDPEKFNPDNFLPDACRNRHPYAFVPFSAGYRNCIGIKYGMFQMKTVISTLVRSNTFAPSNRCPTPEHLKVMILSTLKLVDGCYVKIFPRTSYNTDIHDNSCTATKNT